MIQLPEPVEIDYDAVKEKAEEWGDSELRWNVYKAALKLHDDYMEHGLTPTFLMDPMTGRLLVTSQERLANKFH